LLHILGRLIKLRKLRSLEKLVKFPGIIDSKFAVNTAEILRKVQQSPVFAGGNRRAKIPENWEFAGILEEEKITH